MLFRPDLRPRIDVDPGQEARQMIDHPGKEEQPPAVQPVADAVHAERQHARVKEDLPPRTRRGVAGLDRIQIFNKPRNRSIPLLFAMAI